MKIQQLICLPKFGDSRGYLGATQSDAGILVTFALIAAAFSKDSLKKPS